MHVWGYYRVYYLLSYCSGGGISGSLLSYCSGDSSYWGYRSYRATGEAKQLCILSGLIFKNLKDYNLDKFVIYNNGFSIIVVFVIGTIY